MKTLIIYYSYTGNTKKIAEALCAEDPADIAEIRDVKRPGKIKAYVAGCFAAMRGKCGRIEPLGVDMAGYERLVLLSPIWASNPPPAVNTVLGQLPEGKTIAVKMVSGSGKSGCRERIEKIINDKNGTLESFEDIKMR